MRSALLPTWMAGSSRPDDPPQPAEDLRVYPREAAQVEVAAWTLREPTKLIHGTTVNLSATGALLRLPGLADLTVLLELRIFLPNGVFPTRGRILRRAEPDLVGVAFEALRLRDHGRLIDFLRSAL
jgi:hypothetical protein